MVGMAGSGRGENLGCDEAAESAASLSKVRTSAGRLEVASCA